MGGTLENNGPVEGGGENMLSKVEIEFLKNPEVFDVKYSKSLRHRLRKKARLLCSELELLEEAGKAI
jgi:hypothetical protein